MVKFGPAGNCESFYASGHKQTIEAAKWLKELGLDLFEYSFGKGITLSDSTAIAIGEEMKKYGIEISVHAPYFINFATPTEEQAEKSIMYVINSIYKLRLLGGTKLVVHPASCGKMSREEAIKLTTDRLKQLATVLHEHPEYSDIRVCLETMGKQAQIGTYREIIEFCKLSDQFIPTFDFGHINALGQGCLKTKQDYMDIFNLAIKELGFDKINSCHIHFSKIEYGAKGEIKHLTLVDNVFGPEFQPLAEAIIELGINPTIICESRGIMAVDALKMKNIYLECLNRI